VPEPTTWPWVRRMQVEFLLPLIGATDLDDWPGGVRQQFKAACPMVEDILREIPVPHPLCRRACVSGGEGKAPRWWQYQQGALAIRLKMALRNASRRAVLVARLPAFPPSAASITSRLGKF
jgi:hypothetical protein